MNHRRNATVEILVQADSSTESPCSDCQENSRGHGIFAANVVELRSGPPKTRKLPQSTQSPEGVDLIPSRDGRIRTGDPLNPIQARSWTRYDEA